MQAVLEIFPIDKTTVEELKASRPMDIQKMMKQAQEMQERLKQQMAQLRVEATAGGGMVTVTMNGHKQLLTITIDPEVVSKDDVGMLQDLIVAAVNDANRKVDEAMQQQMGGLLGGLGICRGCEVGSRCHFPLSLQDLVDQFKKLPGIGGKSAQRLAFHVLRTPREDAERLCDAIRNVKDRVTYCTICNNITDTDPCTYCADRRAATPA